MEGLGARVVIHTNFWNTNNKAWWWFNYDLGKYVCIYGPRLVHKIKVCMN
jgi:hypothetical protein